MKPLALIVENDAGTRKLLDVLLTRHGYECDLVADGVDAAVLVERIEYQLLIVDLMSTNARGVDVLKCLRANRAEALSRTVVLTAAPDAHIALMQTEWPQARILRKPFELAAVMDAATAAMERPVEHTLNHAHEFSRRSVVAGAKAGLLVRRAGDNIELVTAFGYPPDMIDGWFPSPISAPFPICESVREQRAVWLHTLKQIDRTYPKLAGIATSSSLAAVPVWRDGTTIGAAGWSFREAQLFDDAERQTFTEIAIAAEPLVPESEHAGKP
jgi:CheY-like chemotaxis protein